MTTYHEVKIDEYTSMSAAINDDEIDSYDRYQAFGYAAARRGQPMSQSIYRLDRHARGGYIDGYNAYLSDAQRFHREDSGMVE